MLCQDATLSESQSSESSSLLWYRQNSLEYTRCLLSLSPVQKGKHEMNLILNTHNGSIKCHLPSLLTGRHRCASNDDKSGYIHTVHHISDRIRCIIEQGTDRQRCLKTQGLTSCVTQARSLAFVECWCVDQKKWWTSALRTLKSPAEQLVHTNRMCSSEERKHEHQAA
jgi:hypothetical protein